jgi:acyl-CoA synthetase (AMP-forming)/AMP-acid ligase II
MNFATLLVKAARQHPDQIAIRYGARVWTYREFADRAARFGTALTGLGLRPGDRVALVQRNGPEYLESFWGAIMAGLTVVPINMRLHPKEILYILNNSRASALVHTDEFNDGLAGIAGDALSVTARISTAPSTGELDYEQLVTAATPMDGPADREQTDPCWLFYTSGTTGRPKGVMWTHRMMMLLVMGYLADLYSMESDDVVLHAAPLSHGCGVVALASVARGAENIIFDSPSFDPPAVFELVQRHGITNIAFLAPTQIVKLLDQFEPDTYDQSSLRCVVYGGGPMYLEHLQEAMEIFGPIWVQIFGQGETPLTCSYLSARDHLRFWRAGDERLGSAGVSRTGIEMHICDDDDQLLPPNTVGEIVVRGDFVMPGYWENQEATDETLRSGWLHTGDIGRIDEHGYLYILDRSKDMLVSGGNNIYPREVEEVLLSHPSVAECAVIGIPDDYWGESVHAIVVSESGAQASAEDLIAHCAQNLASYKKPRSVEFRDDLPKNAYGKILKRELRESYWEGYDRRVGGGLAANK